MSKPNFTCRFFTILFVFLFLIVQIRLSVLGYAFKLNALKCWLHHQALYIKNMFLNITKIKQIKKCIKFQSTQTHISGLNLLIILSKCLLVSTLPKFCVRSSSKPSVIIKTKFYMKFWCIEIKSWLDFGKKRNQNYKIFKLKNKQTRKMKYTIK